MFPQAGHSPAVPYWLALAVFPEGSLILGAAPTEAVLGFEDLPAVYECCQKCEAAFLSLHLV